MRDERFADLLSSMYQVHYSRRYPYFLNRFEAPLHWKWGYLAGFHDQCAANSDRYWNEPEGRERGKVEWAYDDEGA
jgi:hypothetical protein